MEREDFIPISALQHAVYCLRQAALIHLEQAWEDNRFTAEGHVMHAVADKGGGRWARGLRRVMALPVASARLRLTGIIDVVEFHPQADGPEVPYPIEYKRGRPKLHRADEVQLCAQAICLEEMTGVPVSAAMSTMASEFGVMVDPTITSTLSSVTKRRAFLTAVVVSLASSKTM